VPQSVRVARNESAFRAVNERIREVADRFAVGGELQQFVCECSWMGCSEPIQLTLAEYAAVRAEESRFAVAQEHHRPEFEHVVSRTERYWVVEKHGLAELIAEEEAEPSPEWRDRARSPLTQNTVS
jgi:hypothetical protein